MFDISGIRRYPILPRRSSSGGSIVGNITPLTACAAVTDPEAFQRYYVEPIPTTLGDLGYREG